MINSMISSIKKQECSYILLQGIFLISVLFFALFISSILFIFHISISSANLLLAVLCSMAVTFYFSGASVKKTVMTAFVGLLIISACVFLCMHVYDWSWDGNAYRKSRMGSLKYGWNPIYENFFEFVRETLPFINTKALWYDAAPKASEILGAVIYCITNNIESGKYYTFLAGISLFLIAISFLQETKLLDTWQCICCSLFAVFNPCVFAQAFTACNDALLIQTMLLCMISLMYLTFYKQSRYSSLSWYFIFISLNIGFNIKASAPVFFAIICLAFSLYWVVEKIKADGFSINIINYFKRPFLIFVVAVLSGLLITGSTSYLINSIRYGDPFASNAAASGAGIANEINAQMPICYKNLSNIERFAASLFSRTDNNMQLKEINLKIPLTFNSNEIIAARDRTARIAGWGIFFSGIFIISLCVLFFYLLRGKNRKINNITILLLCIFWFSIIFIPGLSWSKYNMFIFWIPVGALLYLFIDVPNKLNLFLSGILSMLLFLNMIPSMEQNYIVFKEYNVIDKQFEEFKFITESNRVVIGVGNTDFYGRYFNLLDKSIEDFDFGKIDPHDCAGSIPSNNPLYYDIKEGILQTNNLKDFLSYVKKNDDYIILCAVKDEASNALNEDIINSMQSLGLEFDLSNHYRWSYLAIIDAGNVLYENMSDSKLDYQTEIAENVIEMQSAGYEKGNLASIKINDVEYALNKRGLNIVVYNKRDNTVIDSVCIDTYNDNSLNR